jgi:uncharacterized membrane protein
MRRIAASSSPKVQLAWVESRTLMLWPAQRATSAGEMPGRASTRRTHGAGRPATANRSGRFEVNRFVMRADLDSLDSTCPPKTDREDTMSRSSLARLALLALLWGSGFLWIKLALRGFGPTQIVLIRLSLCALVLTPIALARGLRFPTDRMNWVHLFVAALVANAIPYTLFGVGERTVGSNVAGVVNATTPLWTVLFAFLAGTDRTVSLRRGIGLALGFAGTVLIFAPWESANEIAS